MHGSPEGVFLQGGSGDGFVDVTQLADGEPLIQHHTSGHATPADLVRLVQALKPEVVVPIHTEAPDAYATTVGEIVQPHADGAWWTV